MRVNLENVDGFVVNLNWNVIEQYEDIFGKANNLSLIEMQKAIIDYYTQTYDIVLCKSYNVFQVIEDTNIKLAFEEKEKIYHSDLVVASLEKRCYKFLTKDKGFFFVEKFDEDINIDNTYDREERDRAKIYDEFGCYLDYIPVENITNIHYWTIITNLINKDTGLEILHSLDIGEDMITGDSVENVLKLYADFLQDYDEQDKIEEIYERILDKNWTEKDLIQQYYIQKIGTVYFIILT